MHAQGILAKYFKRVSLRAVVSIHSVRCDRKSCPEDQTLSTWDAELLTMTVKYPSIQNLPFVAIDLRQGGAFCTVISECEEAFGVREGYCIFVAALCLRINY